MKSFRLLPFLPIAAAALIVGACGKAPLVPDAPKGPVQWLRGIAEACTTSTTDPSGVQVSYQFDWGDGTKSQWSAFMDGGVAFSDTHSYDVLGQHSIKVRAKNSRRASGWSPELGINVVPAEGAVAWSIGFTDPEDIEDSSDFTSNSFAIGPNNTPYIACDYGAVIACKASGLAAWKFTLPELDPFTSAPLVADDGTIMIGCSNDYVYALNPDGSVKWADSIGSQVFATGALGSDGTAYFQTVDTTVVALRPDGSKLWEFYNEGSFTAPVVGADGTVYAINQNGTLHAIDPSNGNQKWVSSAIGKPVTGPPAIDPTRNLLYAIDNETGVLQSVSLADGTGAWQYAIGPDASGPVVGPDGSVYACGNGLLTKLSADGELVWVFAPPLGGVLSTPAITADGYVYVLAVAGKKKRLALRPQYEDSLYAVNPDGSRRWACGLGEGLSDPDYPLSSPKLDASGFIYIGDGFRGWCVAGVSAPAQSIWPMISHDAQNTGRAR
jgi:outer membrane protein assembly factor BamB